MKAFTSAALAPRRTLRLLLHRGLDLRPDGSIRVAVGATGIVEASMAAPADARIAEGGSEVARADAYGRYVARTIVAVNHDRCFNFRLNLEVDGPVDRFQADRLVTERLPEGHPHGSVWVVQEATARTEREAMLDMDLHRPALRRVVRSGASNQVSHPTSYQLVPGMSVHTLLSADDYPRPRAGFIDHHL